MRRAILLFLVFVLPCVAQAQRRVSGVTADRVTVGNGAPSSLLCFGSGDVGKVYVRRDAAAPNASFYSCAKTGASSFAWELSGGGLTTPVASDVGGTGGDFSASTGVFQFAAGVGSVLAKSGSGSEVLMITPTGLANGDISCYVSGSTRWQNCKPQSTCEITFGDNGAASPVLADDNDQAAICGNDTGRDQVIVAVACRAATGAPTVTPILTAGSATSIVTGACTCGTGSWTACALSATPTLKTFSSDGAACAATPCTLDANITTAGGTAKALTIRVVKQ